MDYKKETVRTYNSYPSQFDEKFENYFWKYVKPEADNFISMLNGNNVLDLGSGPGNHASYLMQYGCDVLCVDISREMVAKCREKGLQAVIMDIESLALKDSSFDGVWAYASLLHIQKESMPIAIEEIKRVLKKRGLLAFAVKEGQGQQFESDARYPGTQRWFSYFTDDEIRQLFGRDFKIRYSCKTFVKGSANNYVFLKYLARLKPF